MNANSFHSSVSHNNQLTMSNIDDYSAKKDIDKRKEKYLLEAERIKILLEDTLSKFEFAMLLPETLKNHWNLVEKHLSDVEIKLIKKGLGRFLCHEEEEGIELEENETKNMFLCLHSSKEIEKFFNNYSPKDETIPKEEELGISMAIQILYEKAQIKNLIFASKDDISFRASSILENLRFVFNESVKEMKISPDYAAKREENLRQVFNRHLVLSDYSNFSQETYEDQFNRDMGYFDERIKELKKWETQIEGLKNGVQNLIQEIQKQTHIKLMYDLKKNEEKREALLVVHDSELEDVSNIRKKHSEEEKELRVKRYKTQQQLLNILKMYDRDLFDRQNVYDAKKEALDEERKILRDFQAKHNEQTEIYERLMKEKQEYEERIIEGRLYELRCKMAARKIQRCFKRYLAVAGLRAVESRKTVAKKAKGKSKR